MIDWKVQVSFEIIRDNCVTVQILPLRFVAEGIRETKGEQVEFNGNFIVNIKFFLYNQM